MNKTVLELAKELDFEHEYQYYDYIMDSIKNGQRQQSIRLYSDLSEDEKIRSKMYIKGSYSNKDYIEFLELIS